MPSVTLNGVAFSATVQDSFASLWAPARITPVPRKIGTLIVADNGTRRWVQKVDASSVPIVKTDWVLEWPKVAEATRAAVETAYRLSAPFTAILGSFGTFTVQTEGEGDFTAEQLDEVIPGSPNTYLYRVQLTLHQP